MEIESQHEFHLLIVVDDVQLTDAPEVLIQKFNIIVNDLQSEQLIVTIICVVMDCGD